MNAMKDFERREHEQAYRQPRDVREGGGSRAKNERPKEPKFHRERGHNTEECFQLKDEIEREREFVLKVEEEEAISFDSLDRPADSGDMNDPMVIKLDIANFTVHKVLVDSGSSADIIFKSMVDKMGLQNARLEPVKAALVSFGGSEVASLGMIELPVSMGEEPKRKTLMNGIGEVACDQKEVKKCYNLSLKGESNQKKRKIGEDTESWPYVAEHMKPSGEYKAVQLVESEQGRTMRIAANMGEKETAMIEFLRRNVEMFVWSPSNFTSVNLEVIVHRLNVGPIARPEVAKLLEAGYVSEVQYTDWLSNVVLVPKSSGKWRMCVDFTDLNKACPEDPYPLPRINVTNAGATYQRLVNKMFHELIGRTMEVYVDDMLVKSKRSQDHLEHLEQAFNIMRTYGMKLNLDKCTFGVGGDKFLGYMVSERRIEANPEKIQAIMSLRSPTTIKEVQKLTGKIASLNRFISRSADKSLPFFKILRKTKNFEWNEECEKALQGLKDYLTRPPLLANPKEGETLFLYLAVSERRCQLIASAERRRESKPYLLC
ncbi:UNVERIFIED_CONTAM: Retrovirus-related Pol polyprotein from transposon opus [Sesamum indicum]